MKKFENGFLSNVEINEESEFAPFKKVIKNKFQDYFNFIYQINKFSHNLLGFIKLENDANRIFSNILFTRILELFQSCAILLEKGTLAPAKIIARCMIEPVCSLEIAKKDNNFFVKYSEKYELQRNKFIELIIRQGIETKEVLDEINKIKDEIGNKRISDIKAKELIEKSGLKEMVEGPYIYLSESVHSSIVDLENDYLVRYNDDIIFRYGPKDDKIDIIIVLIIPLLLISLENLNLIFELNLKNDIDNFYEKFIKLAQN